MKKRKVVVVAIFALFVLCVVRGVGHRLLHPLALTLIVPAAFAVRIYFAKLRQDEYRNASYEKTVSAYLALDGLPPETPYERRREMANLFLHAIGNHLALWPKDQQGDMPKYRSLYTEAINDG